MQKWLSDNRTALNQDDVCTLSTSWKDEADPKAPGSSVWSIQAFLVSPDEEGEMREITRSIKSRMSNVTANVGVRYLPTNERHIVGLQIALAFEGRAEDVFDEISRSEAHIIRDKNWRSLTVLKEVRDGHMRYRFTLACESGKTFLSFRRRPAKQATKSK